MGASGVKHVIVYHVEVFILKNKQYKIHIVFNTFVDQIQQQLPTKKYQQWLLNKINNAYCIVQITQ